jgi:hypothetical protein
MKRLDTIGILGENGIQAAKEQIQHSLPLLLT